MGLVVLHIQPGVVHTLLQVAGHILLGPCSHKVLLVVHTLRNHSLLEFQDNIKYMVRIA